MKDIQFTVKSSLILDTVEEAGQIVYVQELPATEALVPVRVRYVQFSLVVAPHASETEK